MSPSAPPPPPPRRVRLHIYDGDYEVLPKRMYVVTLDMEGPGLSGLLTGYLQSLTREAIAANEPMDHPRLEVRDPVTRDLILSWTGV